jgi:hypothetical protein
VRHVVVLLAALSAFVLAAPAHADANSYMNELDKKGIPYSSRSAAIDFGNHICQQLQQGTPFTTLAALIASDGFYSSAQAGVFIGTAVGGLCPDQGPSIRAQMAIAQPAG